jgi:tRNA threonylcarbamoyl adenosine modification protein YeaZ
MYNTHMKYTLAIESSTATPSAALLKDSELLAESDWDTSRGSAQRMFSAITEMLQNNSITLNDIGLFAIGLGPGNFTGLRTTLAAIQAMALPDRTDVIGISSAEAAAYQFAGGRESEVGGRGPGVGGRRSDDQRPTDQRPTDQSPRILVVGDARRRRLWLAAFSTDHGELQRSSDFELVSIDDFAEKTEPQDRIITPDWNSLKDELPSVVPAAAELTESAITPTAAAIARLARRRQERDLPSEPLQPIYMHPPVFVKPRFS